MAKLLYIKASPRGADSKSAALAEAYVSAFLKRFSDTFVDRLDLNSEVIPEFDGDKVAAKMAIISGQPGEIRRRSSWEEVAAAANRFISADLYLIAVPMWNGGIPYRLKQYIDVIHQPGLLWALDPRAGYFGLLKNKRAVLTLTSGAYGPSMPSPAFGTDHHSTYLRDWLNQAGVTDIEELRFQPTLLAPDSQKNFETALATARSLAERF